MMIRALFFLLLVSFPVLSFAKYCPTCLQTFQTQTIRGETQTFYHWLMKVRNPKNPLKYEDFKRLYDENIEMMVNGMVVARGRPAVYRYLLRLRQQQPLKEHKLKSLLVEGSNAVLEYQLITQRRGHKYRSFVIAILQFKRHKLIMSSAVSHTFRIAR